jgi:tetratricopeptide (TPR) repeat protein
MMVPLSLLLLSLPSMAQDAEQSATAKALAAVPSLYVRRDRAGVAAEAIALLDAAIAEDPDNPELHWRVARYHFWLGDTANNNDLRVSHSKQCWDHAERVKVLDPSLVQGHYWAMACIGTYSEGVGILNAVRQGLATKFEENGLRAESIDANYDSGGPLRALGRFHDQLPWPLRDAEKSRAYLNRALAVGPNHARNLYFMADLELEEGNEAEARAILDKILALPEAGSGNPPEVRRYHVLARALMAEIDG